jgi:hypothetical protein
MLATTLWFVVALGLTAALVLESAAAFARSGVRAAADHAIETVLHDAVADYQKRLGGAIAVAAAPLAPPEPFGGTPESLGAYAGALATLPNPLQGTIAADPAAGGPPLTLAYTVTATTAASPDCDPAAPAHGSGADTVAWLQCSGFVQESRLSLRVAVQVRDANGAPLAQREQYVTLRLFAAPPYSAVVGRKDGAAADPAGNANGAPPHEGDLGGATIAGTSPSPSSAPPAGETLIHVRYECVDGAGSCANAAPPDPDADLRQSAHWTNGNVPTP